MRKVLLVSAALSLSAMAISGCSSDTSNTNDANKKPSASSQVANFSTLSENFNGFMNKAEAANMGDTPPETVDALIEKVDYTFTPGVTLSEFNSAYPEGTTLCFVGSDKSYLTLTASLETGNTVRTFGTGACDYEDGDIVLTMENLNNDPADAEIWPEVVTEGEAEAAKIPSLKENPSALRESRYRAVVASGSESQKQSE